MRIAWVIAVTLVAAGTARADGGVVRARQAEGPFTITIFTAADRVVAGPVDVSVLVQDRADGAPILDARVTIALASAVNATHAAATNKLLYAAWVDVPPGRSDLRVRVERADDVASVDVPVSAGPAGTRLARYWAPLLVPPVAILLFVLHQHLASARRAAARRSGSGLHRLAMATAAATFVLLFLGGLVTSTGSGLAVPDWPLSFGQVFPPMVGGVLFEHGHRLAATVVGCLTVVLALWTVVAEARTGVRALGLLALLAVVLQGVLGGITVLYKLPLAVSVTHACLAQTFFCLTVTLALVTSRAWSAPRPRRSPATLGVLAGLTTGAVFGQLVLGALMRHMHAGLAIPDFPLAFGRLVPPLVTSAITVHFAHRVGALVVAVAVGSTAVHVLRHTDDPWIRRPALLAAGLVVLQVTLGALTIWSRRAVPVATTHLVVGAALLATCLVLTLRTTRVTRVNARSVDPVGVRREALA